MSGRVFTNRLASSAHLGHDDIGEEQVDRAAVALRVEERFPGRSRLDDLVAVLEEDAAPDGADLVIVLDEQDRFGPPQGRRRLPRQPGPFPADSNEPRGWSHLRGKVDGSSAGTPVTLTPICMAMFFQ
jgi:hypothetical protein